MRCAIIHYHELALKGRNRPYFEGKLVRHIRTALKGLDIARVEPLPRIDIARHLGPQHPAHYRPLHSS